MYIDLLSSSFPQLRQSMKIEQKEKIAKELSDLIVYCRSVPFTCDSKLIDYQFSELLILSFSFQKKKKKILTFSSIFLMFFCFRTFRYLS